MAIVESTQIAEPMRKGVKTDLPIFRERLHEALKQLDLSQRQFALSIGKDPRTVNHVFKGPVHPDLGTLKDFCERLNVSADWLLGLSDIQEEHTAPKTLHRFAHLNDITDMSKKLYSAPSYSHLDATDLLMAPMNSDHYEPDIMKGDLLTIDMSVTEVTVGAMYVNSWPGETQTYVNYMYQSDLDGKMGLVCMWPKGTKAHALGFENRFFQKHELLIHGRVVGRYTSMN